MGNPKEVVLLSRASYSILSYCGHTLPKQYQNLVLSRWMRSYRFGNDYIKLTDSDSYFGAYAVYITSRMSKPDATIRVAVLSDDHDVALGFSVVRGNILDYMHVHKDFRKLGIGRNLVPPGIERFTHLTRTGLKLWSTKLPKAVFDPFA